MKTSQVFSSFFLTPCLDVIYLTSKGMVWYSIKIKEQTRKRDAGCTWVRQDEADVVWRDFWRVWKPCIYRNSVL